VLVIGTDGRSRSDIGEDIVVGYSRALVDI
jgi:hypothetical protein